MSYQDSLLLLLSLPVTRLCQMLCIWSDEAHLEKVWGLLLWLETLRPDAPTELSQQTRRRLHAGFLPEPALTRLGKANQAYNETVLELVTQSVFAPLLAARCQSPAIEELCAVRQSWDAGNHHSLVASQTFLDHLPMSSRNQLTATCLLDCMLLSRDRPMHQQHQVAPLLLHVLLFLLHRGYLSQRMLVNLYADDVQFPDSNWQLLAEGLQHFVSEAKSFT